MVGRYDRQYEARPDYPIGYVRWAQGRNMAEFLRMVDAGRVQVKPLISVSEPETGENAYAAVMRGGDTIAALIRYGGHIQEVVGNRLPRLRGNAKNRRNRRGRHRYRRHRPAHLRLANVRRRLCGGEPPP